MKINCVVCGKEVLAIRKTKKTCSAKCRGKIRDPQKVKDWGFKQRRGEFGVVTRFMHRIKYFEKKEKDPHFWTEKKKREYFKRKPHYQKYALRYREENLEKIKQTKKIYRDSEPGRLKSQKDSRKRRAKIKGVFHLWTGEEELNKLKKTKGICLKCGKFLGIRKLTLDHHPPLSKVPLGFEYTLDHITFLCKPCNSKKYNKI